MLARLISDNQAIVVSIRSDLYLFYEKEVHKRRGAEFSSVPTHQRDENFTMWTLIDTDALAQPPVIDNLSPIWPIQASSPNPIQWKTWAKQRETPLLGMPLWGVEELKAGHVLAASCFTEVIVDYPLLQFTSASPLQQVSNRTGEVPGG